MADMTAGGQADRGGRRGGAGGSWMVGVILIVLGLVFLFERFGIIPVGSNWWAIFVYLAAFAGLANAWRSWRAAGGFTSAATASLTWGLLLAAIATILMFNVSWDMWWPVVLIAVGLGLLIGWLLGDRAHRSERE